MQEKKLEQLQGVYVNNARSNEGDRVSTVIERLAVMYPSGNTTAVVFDDLLTEPREQLNGQIMQNWQQQNPDKPEIEQCCFVTGPRDPRAIARVQMFGNEFCGNATRSVLGLLANGQDLEGLIEVSGTDSLLTFNVEGDEVSVAMPLPEDKDKLVEQVEEGVLVHLDGISHLVVTDSTLRDSVTAKDMLESLLEQNRYSIKSHPAFGVTYYDQATTMADFAVWVNEVNTIFDETACGSGTCAIGVALSEATKTDVKLDVLQPSGEVIATESDYDAQGVRASRITGTVSVLHDGEFLLS